MTETSRTSTTRPDGITCRKAANLRKSTDSKTLAQTTSAVGEKCDALAQKTFLEGFQTVLAETCDSHRETKDILREDLRSLYDLVAQTQDTALRAQLLNETRDRLDRLERENNNHRTQLWHYLGLLATVVILLAVGALYFAATKKPPVFLLRARKMFGLP